MAFCFADRWTVTGDGVTLFRQIIQRANDKMHWGDTQSFFQVVLALNIAYYSFRGIWSPDSDHQVTLLSEIKRDSEAVRARLRNRLKDPALTEEDRRRGAQWLDNTDVNALGESAGLYREGIFELFKKLERPLGMLCLADGAISLLLLIYSTLHYGHRLGGILFWILMVVTLFPTVAIVLLNLAAARVIRTETLLLRKTSLERKRTWDNFIEAFPANVLEARRDPR